MAGRYDHIDFKPPKDAIAAYKNGLKRHEAGETGDGMEPITIRMAQAFSRGEPCTPEWARKGNRWWGRNARFADEEPGTPAYAAAQLWGGRNWFAPIVKQMDAADNAAGKRGDMGKAKETKAFELGGEIKIIDEPQGIVEHVVTVFGVLDAVNDVAHPGSWTKTINERGGKFLVLDMHKTDSLSRIVGKPIRVWEVGRDGLPQEIREKYPEATGGVLAHTKFLLNTPEGRGAFERIKEGALREWSYGYDPMDVDYSTVKARDGRDVNARHLRAVKVYEYGPVLWGAVPDTMVTGVKNDEPAEVKPAPEVTENTIRIRLRDPDDFQEDSFRTINIGPEDNGIQATVGRLTNETTMSVQSYIFDKEKFTVEEAQAWVDEHKKSGGLEADEKQMTEGGDAGALVPDEYGPAPYKYVCRECGYKMEGDEYLGAEVKCPKCGAQMEFFKEGEPSEQDVQAQQAQDSKAVSGDMNLPLADRDRVWDSPAAEMRVRAWAGGPDKENVDWTKYRRAYLWYNPDDSENLGAYKLGFADIIDGELHAVPRGIFAASGGRGVDRADIPEADKAAVKQRISRYYGRMRDEFDDDSLIPSWERGEKAGRVLAERNAQRIVGALMTLIGVLEDAGIDVPGYERSPSAIEPEETTGKGRHILLVPQMTNAALVRLGDNLNKWAETERQFFVIDALSDGQEIKLITIQGAPAILQAALKNRNDGKAAVAGAGPVGQPPTSEVSREIELLRMKTELELLEV